MEIAVNSPLRQLGGPILVTGHTGFKGTWLTLLLERLNIEVAGISLQAEEGSLFDRVGRTSLIQEQILDIRDHASLLSAVREIKPTAVIHMAAQPLVLDSYRDPLGTFDINVMGTANILDCAFKVSSVKAVVVVTTDKVYRNRGENRFFTENDALSGHDPYSASKVAVEAVVNAWQQIAKVLGGPRVLSVRAGNVIGGGDFAENRLMPDLIRGLSSNSEIKIRNPNSTRPWQHVLDPLGGYLLGLEYLLKDGKEEAFNFGPEGESLPVQLVADLAEARWGRQNLLKIVSQEMADSRESTLLQLDSTKAKEILKWEPSWTQLEAVESTVKWWKKVLDEKIDPLLACQEDIQILLS